jgi:hypothetical protein
MSEIEAFTLAIIDPQKDIKGVVDKLRTFDPMVRECYALYGSYDLIIDMIGEEKNDLISFIRGPLVQHGAITSTTYIFKESKEFNKNTKKSGYIFLRLRLSTDSNQVFADMEKINSWKDEEHRELRDTHSEYIDKVSFVFGEWDVIVSLNEDARDQTWTKVTQHIRGLPYVLASNTMHTVVF